MIEVERRLSYSATVQYSFVPRKRKCGHFNLSYLCFFTQQ